MCVFDNKLSLIKSRDQWREREKKTSYRMKCDEREKSYGRLISVKARGRVSHIWSSKQSNKRIPMATQRRM